MHNAPAPHREGDAPTFDEEIGYRGVIYFIGSLFAITAVVLVTMTLLVGAFTDDVAELDPPPSPLPEANEPIERPGPELQFFPPVADIEELSKWEDEQLEAYEWVDEQAGIARIPIERALEIMASRGLPSAGEEDSVVVELFGDQPETASEPPGGSL